jgi:hypothetical protein
MANAEHVNGAPTLELTNHSTDFGCANIKAYN